MNKLLKTQPRLRVFSASSPAVNAQRAQLSQCVVVDRDDLRADAPVMRPALEFRAVNFEELQKAMTPLDKPPTESKVSIFVHTRDQSRRRNGDGYAANGLPSGDVGPLTASDVRPQIKGATATRGNIVAAEVTLDQLPELNDNEDIVFIEASQPVIFPQPIINSADPAKLSGGSTEALQPSNPVRVGNEARHRFGEGVLIGIIDVQGFDFSHRDFSDGQGGTRFLRIWDQAGATREHPKGQQFNFGSELTKEHMDAALAAAPGLGVPAYELEPQSSMVPSSHGTHVASIAAGNSGVCSKAGIIGVLLSLPEDHWDRRKSFLDSSRILHAIDYLLRVAQEMDKPIAINVSLGTNGHAHDGTSAVNRWIDSAMSVPGRAICVAAGNAGQEREEYAGDGGYAMGRIHTSGEIPGRGLANDIEWIVVGNGIEDVSENELEIWYSPQDRFNVRVIAPDGRDVTGPVAPGQFVLNKLLPNGTVLSVHNERYHHANGCNYISVYLSPYYGDTAQKTHGIQAGVWKVRLEADEVRNGKYDGWIERDDPRPVGRNGSRQQWNYPSFFSERSNVDNSSVTSLSCGQRVVCVANLDEAGSRINISSSQGPTRDGRCKPDVAAAGTEIIAANGFLNDVEPWIAMTGTSMAAPYVTGVVGLMLAAEPNLTAAQIEGIIQRTARPLAGASYTWLNDAGFGVIAPEQCVLEAQTVNQTTRIP